MGEGGEQWRGFSEELTLELSCKGEHQAGEDESGTACSVERSLAVKWGQYDLWEKENTQMLAMPCTAVGIAHCVNGGMQWLQAMLISVEILVIYHLLKNIYF